MEFDNVQHAIYLIQSSVSLALASTVSRRTRSGKTIAPSSRATGAAAKKFIEGNLTLWTGITSLLQNLGAFFGVYAFSRITTHSGRKPAFAVAFLLAMLSTIYTFWFVSKPSDVYWMIPAMGASRKPHPANKFPFGKRLNPRIRAGSAKQPITNAIENGMTTPWIRCWI